MKYRILVAAMSFAMVSGTALAQMSEFKTSDHILKLPLVKVGSHYFSDMTFFLPPAPRAWQLQSKGVIVSPLKPADAATFDLATSTLSFPVLKVDGTVYSDSKLKFPLGGSWDIVDRGDVLSVTTPGYEMSYPIVSTMPNKYCTDGAGELTYVLDNGQVWKHVADDPCCPLSVTTDSPMNIAGASRVEIYPNPGAGPTMGDFRMMVSYTGLVPDGQNDPVAAYCSLTSGAGSCAVNSAGNACDATASAAPGALPPVCNFVPAVPATPRYASQSGVETCVVRPVKGVSDYPVAPGLGPLELSTTSITGTVGSKSNVYISGGLPPYFVTANSPGVVSYEFLPQSSSVTGQGLLVTPQKAGNVQLAVYDYNRDVRIIDITASAPAAIPLIIGPSSIDVVEGTFVDLYVMSGVPPIKIHNPQSSWVEAPATIDAVPSSVRILMKKSTGDVEMPLYFTDATGTVSFITIKIKPCTGSPTCSSGGGGGGIFK